MDESVSLRLKRLQIQLPVVDSSLMTKINTQSGARLFCSAAALFSATREHQHVLPQVASSIGTDFLEDGLEIAVTNTEQC